MHSGPPIMVDCIAEPPLYHSSLLPPADNQLAAGLRGVSLLDRLLAPFGTGVTVRHATSLHPH